MVEYKKCGKCGFTITNTSIYGWFSSETDTHNPHFIHGSYCSVKWGIKTTVKDSRKDLRNPENTHTPVTKEDIIRKLLDKIDNL